MPTKVRLTGLAEFQQRAARLEGIGTEIRQKLERYAVSPVSKIWSPGNVLQHATTRMDRAMLAGTRERASPRSVRLRAATRPLVRGIWYAVEFGARHGVYKTYQGRRGGRRFPVRRRTREQLPQRNRRGRVLYRYGNTAVKRVMSLYTQTIVRTIHEALDGRR